MVECSKSERRKYVFKQFLGIYPLFSTLERFIQVVILKLKKFKITGNWRQSNVIERVFVQLSVLDDFAFKSSWDK